MPCSSMLRPNQTLQQRGDEIKLALKRLERYLATGSARIGIGTNGAVMFQGWRDRDDVSDVCAFRTLLAENSWELRQAIARAEMTSGRKVNVNTVASGLHTHDDGESWQKH